MTWYFPSFLASWYYLPLDIQTAPRTHPFTQLLLNKHFGMEGFGRGTLLLNRGTPMEQPPLAVARARVREEKRRQRRERRELEAWREVDWSRVSLASENAEEYEEARGLAEAAVM